MTLASRLPRLLEVIGTKADRLPMTSYWRSVATMGLPSTITKMWRDIGRKLRFFPPNSYLVSPVEGVTLELVTELGLKILYWRCHQTAKYMFDDIFRCLDTIIRVWQTDRQMDGHQSTAMTTLTGKKKNNDDGKIIFKKYFEKKDFQSIFNILFYFVFSKYFWSIFISHFQNIFFNSILFCISKIFLKSIWHISG